MMKLHVGDLVLAVGSPFGLSSTVTMGIISALGRGNVGIADYEDFIQTDAAINPGNSGGALVNMEGKLIGINTAIFSRTGGSEGIGFAIPSSIAVDIVESLDENRQSGARGWMGVAIQEITPALAKSFKLPEQRKGVLISDVNENGPSHSAGMRNAAMWSLPSMVKRCRASASCGTWSRGWGSARMPTSRCCAKGKSRSLKVKVAERPSDEVLAKREPGPAAKPQTETVKPPDNVWHPCASRCLMPRCRAS
jgi:serine protease Do